MNNNDKKNKKLPNMDDKILIIGAKGSLGSQLALVLGNNYRLLLWDKEDLDITDQESLENKITEHKPGIIINTAAYNAVDKCEEDEEEFVLAKMLNGTAVGYLADIALKLDAVLIHFVSDYVFGGYTNGTNQKRIMKQGGYKENDNPCPVNKYGESKLLGENEILKRRDRGLKYYLIRTSKLFGPKGETELAKPNFFDMMLKLTKERDELDIVNEEMSCFTYTYDLAKAIKELMENKKPYGIYHIVNSGPCTWHDAAVELFKMADINIKVNPVSSDKFSRPAKRPKYSVLLNTKLPKLRNWQEALNECLNLSQKSESP